MKSLSYFFTLSTTMLLLYYLDAATTHYIIENAVGREINWTVDTSTFLTILLSPGPALVLSISLWGMIAAEYNPRQTPNRVHYNGWWRFLFSTPYLYVSIKVFIVGNNTSIALGNGSFIAWLEIFVGEYMFLGVCLLFSAWSMIALPFIERHLKRRFPLPVDPTSNATD